MERFITSNNAKIWTMQSGSGTPLLLFNGGPGCDDYLGPVAEMINDLVTVIRFEPRGCGRSDWDGKYDVDTLIEDAEAIRLAYDIDQWIVGGHSAGPGFALAYAMKYPERTLGMVGLAGGKFVDDRDWSAAYHARREKEENENGGIQFTADQDVNPKGNKSWRQYIKRPELFRELSQISIPCVFINGGQDIRPNWPTQQLAELIPNAIYVEIPDANHYLWLSAPKVLRQELRSALDYILNPTD